MKLAPIAQVVWSRAMTGKVLIDSDLVVVYDSEHDVSAAQTSLENYSLLQLRLTINVDIP